MIERWATFLSVGDATPRLTLFEGDTPLLPAPALAKWVGVRELFLKVEGLNPTGSFKDRGMVVAVAKAVEEGADTVLCASTGNTSASAAAYAARAGMRAVVLIPGGNVAIGKIAQTVVYGARIIALRDNFDVALDIARELAGRYPAALVNSVNPQRIDGQATSAYEICEALGDAPDVVALPVGNGGNITAYWLGFRRYHDAGRSRALPRIVGVQAAGAAPFVAGHPIARPETAASAIRIGRPATWEPALAAARESGGHIRATPDTSIFEAYHEIARREGCYCEPASAAAAAGLRAAVLDGSIPQHSRCVCVLTGNGLKDPDHAVPPDFRVQELPTDASAIARALGWEG